MTTAPTPPAPPANETPEQKLDRQMAELGFQRTPRFGGKFTWQGERHGRTWLIVIHRESRTRYSGQIRRRQFLGWRVRIEASTSLMTRLFVVGKGVAENAFIGWIYRLKGQQVVEAPPPLHDERLVTTDVDYARRFAGSREALELTSVMALQEGRSGPGSSVHFGPERIYFASARLQGGEVSVPQIAEWVEQSHQLASIAEGLGPVSKPAKIGAFERLGRENPLASAFAIIGGLGCFFIGLGLLFSGFLMTVAWFMSRSANGTIGG